MNIIRELSYPEEFYQRVQEKMDSRFVCESCLKTKDGKWATFPAPFFYSREPHPESGSHYFSIYRHPFSDIWVVTDGSCIEEQEIMGIQADNGDIIYSRYRHDYAMSYDRSVMIDGGRDYIRSNGAGKLIPLVVRTGVLFVKPNSSIF